MKKRKVQQIVEGKKLSVGDVADISGLSAPEIRRHIVVGVLSPEGSGGPGNHWRFSLVDTIAECVAAAYREAGFGTRWSDAAAKYVASLSPADIEKACAKGRFALIPVSEDFSKWELIKPTGLDSGIGPKLSLLAAVLKTRAGVKRLMEEREVSRYGRRRGLDELKQG